MTTTTFDSLGYAKRLEDAGFTRQQAEVQANAMREIVEDKLATKQDLEALRIELQRDMKELELRLTIRLGCMMAASIAMVAALVKLL